MPYPMRDWGPCFVTDIHPHSALREWRQHMARPTVGAILVGCGVVAGLAGPFGTHDALGLGVRLAYWLAIVAGAYSIVYLTAKWIAPTRRGWPMPLGASIVGVAGGTGVVAFVVAANGLLFPGWIELAALPGFVASVLGVTVIVTFVLELAGREAAPAPEPSDAAPPAVLSRVPLEKRGALVALSVEDHYVRVRTTKGETLVLMRLRDAIGETGAVAGAQVHRSHWVAFDHVRAARKRGDQALLTLSTGEEIPVSRANVNRIREAGLLPRK